MFVFVFVFNRGIAPNLKRTKIEANVFVPMITLNAGYTSNSNLFLLRKTIEGVTNVNLSMFVHQFHIFVCLFVYLIYRPSPSCLGNVEAPVIMDCDIIQKDGKEFVKVKSVHLHLEVSNLSMDFKSKSLSPIINNIANKVLNANWKLLKAEIDNDLERYIGDVIKSIIVPITDKIAIQDLLK